MGTALDAARTKETLKTLGILGVATTLIQDRDSLSTGSRHIATRDPVGPQPSAPKGGKRGCGLREDGWSS